MLTFLPCRQFHGTAWATVGESVLKTCTETLCTEPGKLKCNVLKASWAQIVTAVGISKRERSLEMGIWPWRAGGWDQSCLDRQNWRREVIKDNPEPRGEMGTAMKRRVTLINPELVQTYVKDSAIWREGSEGSDILLQASTSKTLQ